MSNNKYERFADAILMLEPDLGMSKEEIQTVVKIHGLEHFCKGLSDKVRELIEITEIIRKHEEKDQDYEQFKSVSK